MARCMVSGPSSGESDSYGWRDLDHVPTPTDFDAAMMQAYNEKITPIILLEYEGSYQSLTPPQLIGTYDEWFNAGLVYARRFQPNGEWSREHGIRDWGVTIFTAINEPDVQGTIPQQDYRNALAGFADGVHSISAALRVVPGGFARCNSHADPTLGGYGTAIADLLNDGRLDGIDLHTYYNAQWFPLTKGREFSAQSCFDRVKAAIGVTRDINFYSTEFNIAADGEWSREAVAARLLLTAIWDHLGVTKGDGRTPATVLAFPWNITDTSAQEGQVYAMAESKEPWKPNGRGAVYRMVLQLAGDMTLKSADPHHSGTYVLEKRMEDGRTEELHVWQDLPGWSDEPAMTWTLDLPPWAREAELWGWDGKRATMAAHGPRLTIRDLPGNETYMLLVR